MKKIYSFVTLLCIVTISKATIWTVQVTDNAFVPSTLPSVVCGDTVRWNYAGPLLAHTTTSTTLPAGVPPWDQPITSGSATFDYVISFAGTYNYQCTPHMFTGSITVVCAPCAPATGTITATPVSCNGANDGSASLATPSSESFIYYWNTGATTSAITGLPPGVYTVNATHTCLITESATVTEPAMLMASVVAVPSDPCVPCSGSASAIASGGTSPYTYLWSPSSQTTQTATGLCSGNHTLDVTDFNGCVSSATFAVTGPSAALTVSVTSTPTNGTNNDGTATATPSGGTPGYAYLWNPSAQTTQTATGLGEGVYSVTVVDTNGCTANDSVMVNNNSAVINIDFESLLQVYPNPNHGMFEAEFISTVPENLTVEFSNVLGQVVVKEEWLNSSGKYYKKFDVRSYGKGIYLMRVQIRGKQATKKIIVY